MYNMNGIVKQNSIQLLNSQASAKNLYPYRYSIFLTVSQPIKEVVNIGLTAVYSPSESHSMFLSPSFAYTINERWDISLVGQITFNKSGPYYVSPLQAIFLRLKLSF